MIISAKDLLNKYGNPLAIAEALLEGKLDSSEINYVSEIVDKIILEAAKIRIELKIKKRQAKSGAQHEFIVRYYEPLSNKLSK